MTDPNSVQKELTVNAPQAVAWRVFTERMGTWWPLAHYKIGKANALDAVIEGPGRRALVRARGGWQARATGAASCPGSPRPASS